MIQIIITVNNNTTDRNDSQNNDTNDNNDSK